MPCNFVGLFYYICVGQNSKAMKAQEICYGNLVSYLGRTHVIESPNATKSWASPILKNGTLGAVELLDNDKIEPLPITPENLALVGFVATHSNSIYRHKYQNSIDVQLLVYATFYEAHFQYSEFETEVGSISQIQNIAMHLFGEVLQYNAPQL